MLEVVFELLINQLIIPFLLLRDKNFRLSKCYAYLSGFMNKFFPKFLI